MDPRRETPARSQPPSGRRVRVAVHSARRPWPGRLPPVGINARKESPTLYPGGNTKAEAKVTFQRRPEISESLESKKSSSLNWHIRNEALLNA